MSEEKNTSKETDHDILLEMKSQFTVFKTEQFPQFSDDLKRRIDRFFEIVKDKADKEDVKQNRDKIDDLNNRVTILELTHRDAGVKKEAFLQVGKVGVSTWQFIVGFIGFLITVLAFIRSLSA